MARVKKIKSYKPIKIEMSQSDFFKMVANEQNRIQKEYDSGESYLPPEKAIHKYMYNDLAVELCIDGASKIDAKKDVVEPWNYTATIGHESIKELLVIDRSKQQVIARIQFN